MRSMLSPQPSSLTIIPLPLVVVALVPGVVRLRVFLKGLIRRAEIGSVVAPAAQFWVGFFQKAGRCPSAPTLARLRPPLHRSSSHPPAASTSCRAAMGAAVTPAAGRERGAAESPADAPPPAASAVVVADVLLEHGPGARSSSRPSIVTDDSYPNHLACMWSTQ